MQRDFWQKQSKDKPLFPNLIWSQPENKALAGKLAIIGGNVHGFAAVAQAYTAAAKAGAGSVRVVLPDILQKTVGKAFVAGEFAPSTPSGSLAKQALGELLGTAEWADLCLLAGDFGRNSETAVLLEAFAIKYKGLLTVTKDGLDYFTRQPGALINREDTLLVLTMAQLQKLATASNYTKAFTFDMDLIRLVDELHNFSNEYPVSLIIKHGSNIFVAHKGQVSSTKTGLTQEEPWRVEVATQASVWWLQNPDKVFQALTSALVA